MSINRIKTFFIIITYFNIFFQFFSLKTFEINITINQSRLMVGDIKYGKNLLNTFIIYYINQYILLTLITMTLDLVVKTKIFKYNQVPFEI